MVSQPQQVRAEGALPDTDAVGRVRHTDPQQWVGAQWCGFTGDDPMAGVVPWRRGQGRVRSVRVVGLRQSGGVEGGVKNDGVVGIAHQGAQAVVMLLVQGVGDRMGE